LSTAIVSETYLKKVNETLTSTIIKLVVVAWSSCGGGRRQCAGGGVVAVVVSDRH